MNEFLKKVGLQKEFAVELNISKHAFMEILQNHVNKPGSFFRDLFNFHKIAYTGKVEESDFELKSNAWAISGYAKDLIITGQVRKVDGKLKIEVTVPKTSQSREIFELYLMVISLLITVLLTINIVCWYLLTAPNLFLTIFWFPLLLIILSIHYFFIRKTIGELAEDFERDIRRMVNDKMIRSR
jgi:hypothetical protein